MTSKLAEKEKATRDANRRLLAENSELKLQNAQMRKRLNLFEQFATESCKYCVDRMANGEMEVEDE